MIAAEMAQVIELAQTISEQQKMLATALAKLVRVEEVVNLESLNLLETWDKYIDFKKPSVSPSYLAHQLQATRNHLEKLSGSPEIDAVAVRDWAMKNLSVDSAKRLISQLSACYVWAKNSRLIDANPFAGMASEIKLPRSKKTSVGDREIDLLQQPSEIQSLKHSKTIGFVIHLRQGTICTATMLPMSNFFFTRGVVPAKRSGCSGKISTLISESSFFRKL